MKEFLEYIIKNLVDSPEDVDVQCLEDQSKAVLQVRVAQSDVGKVIGAKGRTIKALRTISSTISSRIGKRIHVELVE